MYLHRINNVSGERMKNNNGEAEDEDSEEERGAEIKS